MKYWLLLTIPVVAFAADSIEPQATLIVLNDQTEINLLLPKTLKTPLSVTSGDITITFQPSGKTFSVSSHVETGGDPRFPAGVKDEIVAVLKKTAAALPDSRDKTVQFEIRNVLYEGASSPVIVTASGPIYTSSNVDDWIAATSKALAPSKTTDEKDLFAGFNIAIPSKSSNSGSQGDFVVNRTVMSLPNQLSGAGFADSGMLGLRLKKGSEDGKDPKHLSLGFSLRKTRLLIKAEDKKTLFDALNSDTAIGNDDAMRAMGRATKPFFRAFLFDYGLQMESDVTSKGLGNVSNMIGDFKPQFATASHTFAGNSGFFNLRFMPAGLEVGHNLSVPDAADTNAKTRETGSLVRIKSALEARFFYQSKADTSLLNRVELSTAVANRVLLQDEIAYDVKTKLNVNTAHGAKPWVQTDFKISVGPRIGNIRPGFKLTYQRGSLPPVYADTKVFTYGLVFESAEDSK